MIKILETESSLGWGGQENRTARLINSLDSSCFEVCVATPKEAELYKRRDTIRARFFHVDMKKSYSLKAIWELYKIIKKERIDIVSTHSGKDAWLGVIAAKLAGARAIRTRHLQTPISSPLSYNLHDKVVCVSDFVLEDLKNRGVDSRRLLTIRTGIDTQKYQPQKSGRLREILGVGEDIILVGIVAVLRGAKGHKILLEAVAELADNVRLVIIGDGPQRENIENEITRLGLGGRAIMLGHREDVAELMPGLDIFVLPSRMEALGTAILEASACGVAVVGSDAGGIPECVRENGLLFGVGEVGALRNALATLAGDLALRKEMGRVGRELVEREFSIEVMTKKTEVLYKETIKDIY
ncbi:MAG: glycosyltransferase [Wolinella sp.]